jgi:hypothetical protein
MTSHPPFGIDLMLSAHRRIRDARIRPDEGNEQGKRAVVRRSQEFPSARGIDHEGLIGCQGSSPWKGWNIEMVQDSGVTNEANVCKSTFAKHAEEKDRGEH